MPLQRLLEKGRRKLKDKAIILKAKIKLQRDPFEIEQSIHTQLDRAKAIALFTRCKDIFKKIIDPDQSVDPSDIIKLTREIEFRINDLRSLDD